MTSRILAAVRAGTPVRLRALSMAEFTQLLNELRESK